MTKSSRTFVLASVLATQLLTACTTRYVRAPQAPHHAHATATHADGRPDLRPVIPAAAPSASVTVTVASASPREHYVTTRELDARLAPIKEKVDRTYDQTDRNTTILECEAGDDAACAKLAAPLPEPPRPAKPAHAGYNWFMRADFDGYILFVADNREAFDIVDSDDNNENVKRVDVELHDGKVMKQARLVRPSKMSRFVGAFDGTQHVTVYIYRDAVDGAKPIGYQSLDIKLPLIVTDTSGKETYPENGFNFRSDNWRHY